MAPRMVPGFTAFANTVEVHGLVLERPHILGSWLGTPSSHPLIDVFSMIFP